MRRVRIITELLRWRFSSRTTLSVALFSGSDDSRDVMPDDSWKAFWKPAACCVAASDALMLETKVLIFLLVSLVAGESRLL
ncbi:hypothetical protein EYF80_055787 [Liparis tanakae]|uniref:Uncharacterized protein n=1 Tax=Liparis tanakae TaxID=230148 RepID=A0A4Z2EZV5_9TELE|nr:hypothetical protein EYF80_055787 [Liparis tanakae]